MALIKRLTRITRARIDAFLDSLEDPASVVPQLRKELKDNVHMAGKAEAKALTALRSTQRKMDEATGRALRLAQGARLAVERSDEETARESLILQGEAEKEMKSLLARLAGAENAYEQARGARLQLQRELVRLKARESAFDRETVGTRGAVERESPTSILNQLLAFAGSAIGSRSIGEPASDSDMHDDEPESFDVRLGRYLQQMGADRLLKSLTSFITNPPGGVTLSKPDDLSLEEKLSHFRNLVALAHADQKLDDREKVLLAFMAHRWGLTPDAVTAFLADPDRIELKIPEDADARFDQLYDLAEMMMVDGKISEEEKGLAEQLAAALGFKPEAISTIARGIVEGHRAQASPDATRESLRSEV